VRAVVCSAYGPPEVLKLEEVPTPTPTRGQVRIRVRATAVTSSDCYLRGLDLNARTRLLARLVIGWNRPRQPILGMVLSGEVDAIGPDVTRFASGERVFGFDRHLFGTYAEYVCWPADGLLASRPPQLSDTEAAALPYGGLLALHFLRRAGVGPGKQMLIYGASGAVGTSAVQLAVLSGARVTGVCSTRNADLVRSLGASDVIDYTREDLASRGGGYDVFFDAVGKRKSAVALRSAERLLAPGGQVVSVDDGTPKLLRDDMDQIARLASIGDLRPVIDRVYRLEEIVEAHRYVSAGHKRGNVVVTID
jgi:NADPH:quinone reductase-like Zn-dependent oxidoreductase